MKKFLTSIILTALISTIVPAYAYAASRPRTTKTQNTNEITKQQLIKTLQATITLLMERVGELQKQLAELQKTTTQQQIQFQQQQQQIETISRKQNEEKQRKIDELRARIVEQEREKELCKQGIEPYADLRGTDPNNLYYCNRYDNAPNIWRMKIQDIQAQ